MGEHGIRSCRSARLRRHLQGADVSGSSAPARCTEQTVCCAHHAGSVRLMGRMVYWMNVSLDLLIEAEGGDRGAGDWLRIDAEVHAAYNALARDLALMVEGRVVYEVMEAFWPAAATDPTMAPYLQEYGRIWTQMPKVLVSQSRKNAEHNTRVIGGADAIDQLAAIRAGTDGTIGVGGATLATALLEHELLDELLLFVHPTILGRGRRLFDRVDGRIPCDLREHRVFANGVAMHRYDILDRSASS